MKLNRRTFIGGVAAASVVATVNPTLAFSSSNTEKFVAQIRANIEDSYKWQIKCGSETVASNARTLQTMLLNINERITRKLSHLITEVSDGPVFSYQGNVYEMMTRKLASRWTFEAAYDGVRPNEEEIVEQIFESLSSDIADEFKDEFKTRTSNIFIPYVFAISSGICLDPETCKPIVAFLARYQTQQRLW